MFQVHLKVFSSPVFSEMLPENLPGHQEAKGQEYALFPVKLTKRAYSKTARDEGRRAMGASRSLGLAPSGIWTLCQRI